MSKKHNLFASSSKDVRPNDENGIILISSSSGSSRYLPSSDEDSEYSTDQTISDSDVPYDPSLEEETESTNNLSGDDSLDDEIMGGKYLRHKQTVKGCSGTNTAPQSSSHGQEMLKFSTFKREDQTVLVENSDGDFAEENMEVSDGIIIEVESTTEEIEMLDELDIDVILLDSPNEDIDDFNGHEDVDPYGAMNEDDSEEDDPEEDTDWEIHIKIPNGNMSPEENIPEAYTHLSDDMLYENYDAHGDTRGDVQSHVNPCGGDSEGDPKEDIPAQLGKNNPNEDSPDDKKLAEAIPTQLGTNSPKEESPEDQNLAYEHLGGKQQEERVSQECLGTKGSKRIVFVELLTGEFEQYEMELPEDASFIIQSISGEIVGSCHGVNGATSGKDISSADPSNDAT